MKFKKIKVLYSNRYSSYKFRDNNTCTCFPKISMEGKWLEALGFHIGDQLEVAYEEGSIHIRLAEVPASVVCEPESAYLASSKRKAKK